MKRGEAYEKIKEEIRNNPGITKGELEDKFPHNTVWYNIYSNKGKLKKEIRIELKPTSKGQTVDTYYLITPDNNLADPDYLKFLIQNYESSTSLRDRYKQIQINKDIFEVCQHKKIRDEEFINFLIKHSKKREIWELDFERENVYRDDHGFWICLGSIANNLLKAIEIDKKDNATKEESLLKTIRGAGEFLEKVVFNRSDRLLERELALDVLRLMNHPKRHDIAFELLEKIDTEKKLEYDKINNRSTFTTELDAFRKDIESLVFSYNKINPTDCRKRLYALLDANLGSVKPYHGSQKKITFTDREMKLRKEIMYLLDMTRNKQYG